MRTPASARSGLPLDLLIANLGIAAGFLLGLSGGPQEHPVSTITNADPARILSVPLQRVRKDFYSTDALVEEAMGQVTRFYRDATWPQAKPTDLGALQAQGKRLGAAIVQVISGDPEGKHSAGSGIVLGRGRWVLTAQHVVQGCDQHQIRTRDGRMIEARMIIGRRTLGVEGQESGDDWAILGLVKPLTDSPAVDFGICASGQLVVSFGYGRQLGIGMDGQARWMKAASQDQPLDPLPAIYRCLESKEVIRFRPLAGLLQGLGGRSGGPVINTRGELVALNSWGRFSWSKSDIVESEEYASPIVNASKALVKIESLHSRILHQFQNRPIELLQAIRDRMHE